MNKKAIRIGKIVEIRKKYAKVSGVCSGNKDVLINDLKKAGYEVKINEIVDLSTEKGWRHYNIGSRRHPRFILKLV